MKLSQNLYRTGVLGRQRSGPTEWEFEAQNVAEHRSIKHSNVAIPRLFASLRLTPRSWRLLSNILRLN